MKALEVMQETDESGLTWRVPAGAVQRLAAASGGRWLVATGGRLWLTRSGSGPAREADVWLGAGQRQWLAPRSDWLIEGWGDGSFVLLEPPAVQRAA